MEQWPRRPTTAQRVALRSRIMLACAEGLPNRAVAAQMQVSSNSVCKWRVRFRVRRVGQPEVTEVLVQPTRPHDAPKLSVLFCLTASA